MNKVKPQFKAGAMWRQGDVLIVRIDSLPEGLKKRKREDGRVVLAHGEVTGHAHAIREKKVIHFDAPDAASAATALLKSLGLSVEVSETQVPSFLEVAEDVQVVHEEHGTINLTEGKYLILRQQEYRPEAIVRVAD